MVSAVRSGTRLAQCEPKCRPTFSSSMSSIDLVQSATAVREPEHAAVTRITHDLSTPNYGCMREPPPADRWKTSVTRLTCLLSDNVPHVIRHFYQAVHCTDNDNLCHNNREKNTPKKTQKRTLIQTETDLGYKRCKTTQT